MKRFFVTAILSSFLWAFASFFLGSLQLPSVAQTPASSDLYYLYEGKRVPLTLRQDAIAVAFKAPTGGTRGVVQPLYQQLQRDLLTGTRGNTAPALDVRPLGDRYALVTVPPNTRGNIAGFEKRAQRQSYVESTLPVLERSELSEAIVLPNEMTVSFQAELSESDRQSILDRNNLEVIRPLRFTQNRYLVRARSASGTAVLTVANQLNQVAGVKSATPNFIQSLPQSLRSETTSTLLESAPPANFLKSLVAMEPTDPLKSDLLPLQWHLNSTALIQRLASNGNQKPSAVKIRPDLHATEAWEHSQAGKGVVVAVLDSLIQWDHPDLIDSVYTVDKQSSPLPGERYGWDFSGNSGGDPDTRISNEELSLLRPSFQDSFKLSDAELKQKYPLLFAQIQRSYPKAGIARMAQAVRQELRYNAVGEFHGTMTAGVISAHSKDGQGLLGVSPNAKILPVRVGRLGAGPSAAAIIEAVGYAANRGADIISMSFGGLLPNTDEAEAIADVLKAYPNLVIVASSGNESSNHIAFPAAVKGVVAVGATDLNGNRAGYSNFGQGLDVVAPGGNTSGRLQGGILTTSGTQADGFWRGIAPPKTAWTPAQDPKGAYVWTQGTSFSAPAVAGVLALMKGEDPQRRLTRDRLIELLKSSAAYDSLAISKRETELYRSLSEQSKVPPSGSIQQFFFGSGLVNAEAAVQAVARAQ